MEKDLIKFELRINKWYDLQKNYILIKMSGLLIYAWFYSNLWLDFLTRDRILTQIGLKIYLLVRKLRDDALLKPDVKKKPNCI